MFMPNGRSGQKKSQLITQSVLVPTIRKAAALLPSRLLINPTQGALKFLSLA